MGRAFGSSGWIRRCLYTCVHFVYSGGSFPTGFVGTTTTTRGRQLNHLIPMLDSKKNQYQSKWAFPLQLSSLLSKSIIYGRGHLSLLLPDSIRLSHLVVHTLCAHFFSWPHNAPPQPCDTQPTSHGRRHSCPDPGGARPSDDGR